jgi:P pilus assembly chaperone PapD
MGADLSAPALSSPRFRVHQLSTTPPAETRVVEPKKAPSRESLFAANVMEIRSFAALKKTSGASCVNKVIKAFFRPENAARRPPRSVRKK